MLQITSQALGGFDGTQILSHVEAEPIRPSGGYLENQIQLGPLVVDIWVIQ